jgi:hypothetical protein
MAAVLRESAYFTPTPGRGVIDFEGNEMMPGAAKLMEVRCVLRYCVCHASGGLRSTPCRSRGS